MAPIVTPNMNRWPAFTPRSIGADLVCDGSNTISPVRLLILSFYLAKLIEHGVRLKQEGSRASKWQVYGRPVRKLKLAGGRHGVLLRTC